MTIVHTRTLALALQGAEQAAEHERAPDPRIAIVGAAPPPATEPAQAIAERCRAELERRNEADLTAPEKRNIVARAGG